MIQTLTETLLQIDQNILLFIQEHIRQEWMDGFWTAITRLGDAGIIWIALAIILLIPKKTRRAGIAALIALAVGALITNAALKNIVERVRPYETIPGLMRLIEAQPDFSFPSGHSCASFAAAFALFKTFPGKRKIWKILCIILAALIAFSRLYVGVHYPSDVLAGILIGIFAGWAGWKLSK